MIAEQNLKLVIMDSVGETIRHIIAPPAIVISKHDHLEYPVRQVGQCAQLMHACSQNAKCLLRQHVGRNPRR